MYFISKNKTYRNFVLIVFSTIFYAWGEPIWVSLLIISSLIGWGHALIIDKYRDTWIKRAALISSLILNLSFLVFFKYIGFFFENINFVFQTNIPYKEYALPIGISFFTFQILSYVIDVYRGEVAAQKSFAKLYLYVSLFPQLVAGPIVRYIDIAKQIDNRKITLSLFSEGINRFIIGLGKKVIIGNQAGAVSDFFLKGDLTQLSIMDAWFGIMLFALQIYFDFSGYSDMAIGLGKMFGFTYKENFNYPYISKSATEFWRRWHISLGSFFRDYVYIPLGGNRRFHIRNLFVVWFLTGLWHGASWNFIVWGLYYGFLIFIEKTFLLRLFEKLPRFISHAYLIVAMLIGWVFFYFEDMGSVYLYLKAMFGLSGATTLYSTNLSIHLSNNIFFFVLAILLSTPFFKTVGNWIVRKLRGEKETNGVFDFVGIGINVTILLISIALLVGATYNPFLYFRF